ncbi:MAG: MFS transporter [Acidobacteria bacterium]|nr:MFS transporter [Acidobacteriota bacterium]
MIKIPNLRWIVAGLLFTATVINYIDRQTLSVVAPMLTKELNLSPIAYSNILTAFLAAYTAMYLGSGYLVDRWGTRVSLSVFMVWWSISNMLHALVTGAFSLGVFRFLLGIGEPGNFMAAIKATSEWYPAKERALISGFVNAGAAVGAIIATPCVTFLALTYGWRSAFVVTGALGFIWLATWLVFYYVPEKHPRITDTERTLVMEGRPSAAVAIKTRWLDLLKIRQTWGLLLARFFSDPVWWFYLFWLPKYLVEQRGFTMVEMGLLAWLPYLSADVGSIFGGWFSGFLIRRKWEVLRARSAGMLPFALLMPLSIVVAFTTSRPLCLALICVVTFAHMAWKTNIMTVTNDIYPVRVVGSVSGIVAFGNGLGGTLFTLLTGQIVQAFGYETIFVLMGCMHPLAYFLFQLLVRGPLKESQLGPAPEPFHAAT